MENLDLELLAELHALPETEPVELEADSYGGTCGCIGILTVATICVGITCV